MEIYLRKEGENWRSFLGHFGQRSNYGAMAALQGIYMIYDSGLSTGGGVVVT